MNIFLDMDGVVVNHFDSIFKLFGVQLIESEWPQGVTLAKEVLQIEPKRFKREIIAAGEDLWANMPAYPWHKELWEELNKIGDVYYLSSPEYGPGCLAGKLRWMEAQHGEGFNRFVLTQHKTLLAPGDLLIDDTPKNIAAFRAAGGEGILFERPWNSMEPSRQPAQKVLAQAREIFAKLKNQEIASI